MTMEAPNFFMGGLSGAGECYFEQQKLTDINNNSQFTIDDLLVDFPNDGDVVMNDALFESLTGNSDDSSTVPAVHNCNSSVSGGEPQFSGNISSGSFSESQFSGGELFVPCDDLAELEWLTSFTEESFSSDDLHNLQLISAANKAPATDTSSSDNTPVYLDEPLVPNRILSPIFHANVMVPGKARSSRSRAAPCDWTSRLLLLKPFSSSTDIKPHKTTASKAVERPDSSVHRCLHCGSDKTPQWRTGPMGPKTLCNACGVRYKSGRLVPEYRPAASPTFVSAKHSNSHRKVIELRRQKELRESLNQTSIYGGCNGGDDNLILRQSGLNFMHMI